MVLAPDDDPARSLPNVKSQVAGELNVLKL
jgi:hypothetical protein